MWQKTEYVRKFVRICLREIIVCYIVSPMLIQGIRYFLLKSSHIFLVKQKYV